MNTSRSVAVNTLVQFISKSITVLFTLITTNLLTGYLGRDGYGRYMYVLTVVVLFGALADWGSSTIGVREASKSDQPGRHFANIIFLRLLLSLAAVVVLVVFSFYVSSGFAQLEFVQNSVVWAALILFAVANKASFGIIFQTRLEMYKLAVADVTSGFLTLALTWLLIHDRAHINLFFIALAATSLIAAIIALVFALRSVRLSFRLDRPFLARLIKESLPMGAILILLTVDNKIDTLMLGSLANNQAVGVYALSYRVYDVAILGAAYFMASLFPTLSRLVSTDSGLEKLKTIYQRSFDLLLMLGLAALFSILIFAPFAIRLLSGQRYFEFSDSVSVLRLLSIAMFFSYYNHLAGYTIVGIGRQRSYFFVALAALAFNFFTNLIIIPRFSYFGAAFVTIANEILVAFLTTYLIFRWTKIVPSFSRFPRTALDFIKSGGRIF